MTAFQDQEWLTFTVLTFKKLLGLHGEMHCGRYSVSLMDVNQDVLLTMPCNFKVLFQVSCHFLPISYTFQAEVENKSQQFQRMSSHLTSGCVHRHKEHLMFTKSFPFITCAFYLCSWKTLFFSITFSRWKRKPWIKPQPWMEYTNSVGLYKIWTMEFTIWLDENSQPSQQDRLSDIKAWITDINNI